MGCNQSDPYSRCECHIAVVRRRNGSIKQPAAGVARWTHGQQPHSRLLLDEDAGYPANTLCITVEAFSLEDYLFLREDP